MKPAAIPTNSPEILNRLPPNKNHHFRNKVYNTLYTDTRGWTWAGTPDGLELFTSENDSAPRIFYRENGLSNNFIQGIIEDKYRDIWVTTSNGVTRIHINPENKNISFTRFNQLDGALDGEYIKDAVFSSSDGTLYLGGIDGFSIFHPDKDSIHPMLPDPPVFTALRLYGEKVNTGKEYGNRIILSKAAPYTTEIELDYNQNFLTFEFSALNYINHERTYYRYQLEGIDPQWMSTFAGRQGNATVGKGLLQAVYKFITGRLYIQSHGFGQSSSVERQSDSYKINHPCTVVENNHGLYPVCSHFITDCFHRYPVVYLLEQKGNGTQA